MTQIETQGGPEGPEDKPGTRALESPEGQDKADRARAKVASWWPSKLERIDPEPMSVSFTRGVVSAWGPSTPQTATQALAACHHFCLWLLELGHDLDPETSLSDQFIDAYMSGPMSKAPDTRRRNTLYYLRQLNPRRTGPRPSPVSVARDARAAQYLLAGEELPVADVIATYVPKNVAPVRFGRVAELVRSAVAAWGPKTSTKAVNVLCWCTYLATWADANDRPLRTDVVFHPDTVEDYVAMRLRAGADPKSMATEAAALRLISRTICPTLLSRKRVKIAKPDPETPYGAAEIDSLLASSAAAKTKVRRRYSRALIALGLAVGPFGGDYTNVEPAHVRRVGADLVVTLLGIESGRTRQVVALSEYADLLETAAKASAAAGDRYLIGGQRPTRNRLITVLTDLGAERWLVPLTHARLRTTYLVGLMSQGHSVLELLEQAGVTTLASLDRIIPFLGTTTDATPATADATPATADTTPATADTTPATADTTPATTATTPATTATTPATTATTPATTTTANATATGDDDDDAVDDGEDEEVEEGEEQEAEEEQEEEQEQEEEEDHQDADEDDDQADDDDADDIAPWGMAS